jgi:hypothetical protein
MGFLSPWFLVGALAVGLPVWLHLLRQFKRTPRPFSSLMFFERRVQSSTRHRRLRYLQLLSLRVLLFLLLALAFANPYLKRPPKAITRKPLVVVAVDRSFSMRYHQHLARAKTEANQFIDTVPSGSLIEAVAFDSHLESLDTPTQDKSTVHAGIDTLEASDDVSSFGSFARSMRLMEQTTGMRLSVELFTDAQRSSMPGSFADLQLGPHSTLRIHKISEPANQNWAVQSVVAPARFSTAKENRVTASFIGWATSAANRQASLLLDGKVVQSKNVVIPDCGLASVEWTNFEIPYGSHKAQIQIEPHDDLPQDDVFEFSMVRSDPRRVLFLHRPGVPRDDFYFKAALESSPAAGLIVQSAALADARTSAFTQYAFIVLNDPSPLDEETENKLCQYVNKGGAVLVAAGTNVAREGRVPVGGEKIDGSGATQGAGKVDEHASALLGTGLLENVQFVRPPSITAKDSDRVLAQLADGKPLLIENSSGEGRVLVLASTLDNSGSDFPIHASYLPFVVQTGAFLAGETDLPSSVVVGSPVGLRRASSETSAVDVIGPSGKHELSLSEATRMSSYTVTRAGYYDVQKADGRRVLVAVHADRRESDLTPVPNETLALWEHTGDESAPDDKLGQTEQQPVRASLWRYALLLVLLAAIAESVFASRYLARKEEQL